MAQTARMLTMVAQYVEYTGDVEPVVQFLPKIKAKVAHKDLAPVIKDLKALEMLNQEKIQM